MPDSLQIDTAVFSDFVSQDSLAGLDSTTYSDSVEVVYPVAQADSIVAAEPPSVVYDGEPHPFTIQSQSWVAILLLVQFFIYAYVFIRFRKFWAENVKELLLVKERSSIFLDTTTKDSKQSFYLSFLAGINLGIFLYLFITNDTFYYENKSLTILLFMLASLLFFAIKIITLNFLGYVFWGRSSAVEAFRNSLYVLVAILGILLYISDVFLIYGPTGYNNVFFIFGFVCCLCFIILKAYRLLKYFYIHLYSFVYLILYLCTLEILPAALLYVVLVGIEQIM